MDAKEKITTKILLFSIVIFSIPSIAAFIYSYSYHEQERIRYTDLPNTDLSTIAVNGQKLGEDVYAIDKGILIIDCEDGKRYHMNSTLPDIPSKAEFVWGILSGDENCTVYFNGQGLTSVEQCINVIGNNHLIEVSSLGIKTIYLDHENNIQLRLSEYDDGQREFVEIKRIDPLIYKKTSTPLAVEFWLFIFFPSLIFDSARDIIANHTLLSIFDYILVPVIYALLITPIVRMIVYRNRKSILRGVSLISYLLLNHFVLLPIMMSV